MQSLARLAKERHVNASRTQLSKQVLFQTNHHHVHTPDEEGDDGDASPSMSWRLVVSTHSRVYEHSHSFTTCLWTQTLPFIYQMFLNTNSIIHLPHVYEHKQHHSFTTCPWTQTALFIYHMSMNTTNVIHLPHVFEHNFNTWTSVSTQRWHVTALSLYLSGSVAEVNHSLLTSMCMQNAVTAALPTIISQLYGSETNPLTLKTFKSIYSSGPCGGLKYLNKQTKPWQNSKQQNWQYSTIWQEAWKYRTDIFNS